MGCGASNRATRRMISTKYSLNFVAHTVAILLHSHLFPSFPHQQRFSSDPVIHLALTSLLYSSFTLTRHPHPFCHSVLYVVIMLTDPGPVGQARSSAALDLASRRAASRVVLFLTGKARKRLVAKPLLAKLNHVIYETRKIPVRYLARSQLFFFPPRKRKSTNKSLLRFCFSLKGGGAVAREHHRSLLWRRRQVAKQARKIGEGERERQRGQKGQRQPNKSSPGLYRELFIFGQAHNAACAKEGRPGKDGKKASARAQARNAACG